MTGESAEALPTEDAVTRLRSAFMRLLFSIDGVRERAKRFWAAMHGEGERGAVDYEEEVADRVAQIISRKYGRQWHVEYKNGDGERHNGEKRLLTWILGVLGLLLVGGTGGVIAMYGKLSSIEKGQEGHEQRINRLEQERDQRYRAPAAPP
jgi:hypothetical protein